MKKLICALIAALLLLALVPAAMADKMNYIIDAADILTFDDWYELEHKAEGLMERYECGIYVITVDDFTDYGRDVFVVATELYDELELGYGQERSGILLLLSMDDRDFALDTYGFGTYAVTEYGNYLLDEAYLDNFRVNDWYGGFDDYLDTCARLLEAARDGEPIDMDGFFFDGYISGYGADSGPDPVAVIICIAVALLAAGIFVGVNASKMKSVRQAVEADHYAVAGSLNVYNSADVFSHITQTRRRIESSSGSRGSRGGGGGHSGHSGKF